MDWRRVQKLPSLDEIQKQEKPADRTLVDDRAPVSSVFDPRVAPKPGDILLGAYRVDHEIGRGGMGIVYAAAHAAHGSVAIKVLADPLADPAVRARFAIEANVASRITGPNLCRVYEVAHDPALGAPCIVMERLVGEDLDVILAREKQLRIAPAVEYVLQAIDGLASAHALGVVHRDVKLSNLFLTRNGTVKILDFGISKAPGFGGAAHVTRLTKTGSMIGSPVYMAPEQIRNARDVDARADVWSLGIVLYELLAGVPPFAGESVNAILMGILASEPAPLHARRPDVPEDLEHIIRIALQKDRERRFPDLLTMARALVPFAVVR